MKPVHWQPAAEQDAAVAAEWYGRQAGLATGQRFLDAVDAGLRHISRHPASGSTRYAGMLHLDDLRFWPIRGFPCLIFYLERDTHLDVWRILHAQRDIPAWMGGSE